MGDGVVIDRDLSEVVFAATLFDFYLGLFQSRVALRPALLVIKSIRLSTGQAMGYLGGVSASGMPI